MSNRFVTLRDRQDELNSGPLRTLGSIKRAVRNPLNESCPQPELPQRSAYANTALPEFDNLPSLSDENIGDVLEYLLAMVDAFEDHYAEPLRRLREQYHEQERPGPDEQQFDWINDIDDSNYF